MTKNPISKLLVAALLSFGLLASAEAGVGGSFSAIRSAAVHGNVDAIVSELERAEDIPCNSECMSFVQTLLDHDDYRVRQAAAWWFARRPAQRDDIAKTSLAQLAGNDSAAARNAADTLGTFSLPSTVAALAAAAQRTGLDAEARAHIVSALGNIHNKAANPAITLALGDGDATVRLAAVVAWRGILRQTGAAPIASVVGDADVAVRREAASVAGMFGEASARAALEARVASDQDSIVRRNAAWALGQIGDAASRPVLETATTDASSLVRLTAKAALRQLH